MSVYKAKLDAVVNAARSMPGTSGAAALRMVVMDLEGDGPIGGLLHSLDAKHFAMVIDLLQEFRKTGREDAFNSLHADARQRLQG
jgi:hypothetical protein